MKLNFIGAEKLKGAIYLVSEDLGIKVSTAKDAMKVTVREWTERGVQVDLKDGEATVTYGDGTARFLRGLATLVGWVNAGIKEKCSNEHALFETNGAMVDMSRNAVMNVKTVKFMLRKMALMGLSTFMLLSPVCSLYCCHVNLSEVLF